MTWEPSTQTEWRKWLGMKPSMKDIHDDKLRRRIVGLEKQGAIILYKDLPGEKRPDIWYILNGEVIGEDVKVRTVNEVEYRFQLPKIVRFHGANYVLSIPSPQAP